MIEYSSLDDRKEIILDDGTKVMLNTNTVLSYEKGSPRNITLNGEAYFQVAKKEQTQEKFQVRTDDLVVTVLGTEFNVNSRDNETKVFLDEGKVILNVGRDDNEVLELVPGDLVSYSKLEDKIVKKENENRILSTAWKEDVVYFKDVQLTEVLPVISHLYDIKFELSNLKLDQKQFSGGLPVRNLDIALTTLRQVYGIEIKTSSSQLYQITNPKK